MKASGDTEMQKGNASLTSKLLGWKTVMLVRTSESSWNILNCFIMRWQNNQSTKSRHKHFWVWTLCIARSVKPGSAVETENMLCSVNQWQSSMVSNFGVKKDEEDFTASLETSKYFKLCKQTLVFSSIMETLRYAATLKSPEIKSINFHYLTLRAQRCHWNPTHRTSLTSCLSYVHVVTTASSARGSKSTLQAETVQFFQTITLGMIHCTC